MSTLSFGPRDPCRLRPTPFRGHGDLVHAGAHAGGADPQESEEESPPEVVETELDKYLKLSELPLTMPDGRPTDILSWWKLRDHSLAADPESGRLEVLPCLARMARQYHGEPGSSAGAERLFSAASRAHHDLKASMGDMSLEHQLLALANTD